MMSANRVIITRPRSQSEAVGRQLEARGLPFHIEPLLEIEPIASAEEEVKRWLADNSAPQAVIITSSNTVRRLMAMAGLWPQLMVLPMVAVGEATAALLEKTGCSKVEEGGGNAAALIEYIGQHYNPAKGTLLFPSGEKTAGNVEENLEKEGFSIHRIVTYRARAITKLSIEATALFQQGSIGGVLFYSAQAAKAFVEGIERAGLAAHLANTYALALSERVAKALEALPFKEIRIAAAPENNSLLALWEGLALR